MKLAIAQPYFFPYIGYWQLINAVDTFVVYDDVNYIKQGYINRNSILVNGHSKYITLELIGASSNKLINEIQVGHNIKKLIKTIKQNYMKAPYYKEVIAIVEEILTQDEKNLAKFIGFSLQKISAFLNINTNILYSSQIEKNCELKAQDKILNICKNLQASKYINAIGGQNLYSFEEFKKENIELNFLEPEEFEYKQFENEFIQNLSIIDVMMFNSKDEVKKMLNNFMLI